MQGQIVRHNLPKVFTWVTNRVSFRVKKAQNLELCSVSECPRVPVGNMISVRVEVTANVCAVFTVTPHGKA